MALRILSSRAYYRRYRVEIKHDLFIRLCAKIKAGYGIVHINIIFMIKKLFIVSPWDKKKYISKVLVVVVENRNMQLKQ